MVADNAQQTQQCPARGEQQAGCNNEKRTAEESANDICKPASQPNEEECAKNHGWKGFSLKRQLSKVDLKIKSTFSPALVTSQNGVGTDSSSQKSSVFYCNVNESASSLSPVESVDSEESPVSSEGSIPGRESPLHDEKKRASVQEAAKSPVAESENNNRPRNESVPSTTKQPSTAARPVNLTLPEAESKPPRLRKIVKMKQVKREGRLLSVPNLKLPKNDPTICDLRCEENTAPESFTGNLIRRFSRVDKYDSSFQRSRSSSMSSLENITTETISCLTFADSYTKKTDTCPVPTLWVGTSLGSIQTVIFNTPARADRHAHPVIVSTCNGSTFKLKGCILSIAFLDCTGCLIPYSFESWKDDSADGKDRNKNQGKCTNARMSPSMTTQAAAGEGFEDRQFVVLVSEKQARVLALPSQNCLYRQQLAETHIVIKADITTIKDNVCLVCYVSNGHIATYSLPSLRPLIDVDFLPLIDLRIAKTLCFSNKGHGLYLSSPTEIQKFSVSSEFCGELTEMMGDLFIGHDMPEPPKESFFKGLFGGGSRSLDREELFGESSGRASRTVAKHIPGPNAGSEALRERVTTVTSEVNMAHQMVLERGEKLSQLEERTGRMMNEAEGFQTSSHTLMLKYKDKKWYQL